MDNVTKVGHKLGKEVVTQKYVIAYDYDNDVDGYNDDGDFVIILTVFGEGTLRRDCGVKYDALKSEWNIPLKAKINLNCT
jgi:hypothetical protein